MLSEVNCNGHVDVEQRQSQWRDEDQHNGNAEPSEKCASEEEQRDKSPVQPIPNGVDSAGLNELDTETECRGARSSGVAERYLPAGLEEGELERSILLEEGEDGSDCQYTTQESLRNGQCVKNQYIDNLQKAFDVACCSDWAARRLLAQPYLSVCLFTPM